MAEQIALVTPIQTSQAAPAAEIAMPVQETNSELYTGSILPIQRSLSVGAPNDPLEQEADVTADRVMQMPETSFIQRKCETCEDEEQESKINRKPLSGTITPFIQAKSNEQTGNTSSNISEQINSTKGEGSQLPAETRSFMESRFGTDFSGVRVHSGDYATNLSKDLNAQAFAVGRDIYFNEGKFAPESFAGKHLLAHELTHTIQQQKSPGHSVQRKPEFTVVTITAGGFAASARQISAELTYQHIQNDARIMVAIGNVLQVFDGNGVQQGQGIHLTHHLPLPNGIYKLLGNPQMFYQLVEDSNGHLDLIKAAHTDKQHAKENLNIDAYFSAENLNSFNSLLGNATHNFLVMPGAVGNSGGQRAMPGWASEQVGRIQAKMKNKHHRSGPQDHKTPDRLVPWVDENGAHLNAWKNGYHTTLSLDEDESDDDLQRRIEDGLKHASNEHDFNQSERVDGSVKSTGFLPGQQADSHEMEHSGTVPDPQQRRLALADSQRIANWPAYPSHINNYGADISVLGGNNRMQMVLDYGLAGPGLLSQVTGRLQPINYYWEIFNVTKVSTDDIESATENTPMGLDGAYISAESGTGNQLSRGLRQTYEDQAADIRSWGDAGLWNLPLWQVRVAQLQLMAVSSVVRTVGSLVTSYVSIVTNPLNEKNIGWDEEGEFLIRCVATPSHTPDSPNVRASSVAAKVVKVMKVNARADLEAGRPEQQLENLKKKLAKTPAGPEHDSIARQIAALEATLSQSVMQNVSGQLQTAARNVDVVKEIISYRQDSSHKLSIAARLLNVQLQLNNIDPSDYLVRMQTQLQVMGRMQAYGNEQLAGAKADTFIYKPRVVLASEENGQVYNMVMMMFETSDSTDAHRRYRLVDLTSPNTQGHYDGESTAANAAGHTEAIRNAFIAFGENNGYGRGAIAIRFTQPLPNGVMPPANGRSSPGARGRWMQRLADLASVAEIAGLIVTGPAGATIGLVGGAAGAAVAAEGMLRKSHDGRFQWSFQTFMDIVSVVGGIVPMFGSVKRLHDAVHIFGIAQLGTSALALPITLVKQLEDIQMTLNISDGEKQARQAEAFLHAVRSGAVLVLTAEQMSRQQQSPGIAEKPEATAESEGTINAVADAPISVSAEPTESAKPLEPQAANPETQTQSEQVASQAVEQPAEPTENAKPLEIQAVSPETHTQSEQVASQAVEQPTEPVSAEQKSPVQEAAPVVDKQAEGTRVEVEEAPKQAETKGEHAEEKVETPEEKPREVTEEPKEQRTEETEEEQGTHTTTVPRPQVPKPTALQQFQTLIRELLAASPIREPFDINIPAQRNAAVRNGKVQASKLMQANPELMALAKETLAEVGNFKDIRSKVGDGFFGDTPMHNMIAREALQAARMQIADVAMHGAIQRALQYVRVRYPGIELQVKQVDLGTPGFGSDRDVTLQFRGGGSGEMALRARIDASLKAVQEAYSDLRAQGIEPDGALDTNFYTELHESSIRPASEQEVGQINFDQNAVSLAEQRMGMTSEQWTAYRENQMGKFALNGEGGAMDKIATDARNRVQAEFNAAEALANKLKPEGQSVEERNGLLNDKMTELSEAIQRGDSPRAIRQLMAEIKLLEPEAYGTRASVESVVGRQQKWTQGTGKDYMSGRKLPDGRLERLSFLTQEATSNNGLLYGHTKLVGNEAAQTRSGAKYLYRVMHAVVYDGKLGVRKADAFLANLRAIVATKSITDATEANVAVMRQVRAALIADGMAADVVNAAPDNLLRDTWAERARQYGSDLSITMRTAEQSAYAHDQRDFGLDIPSAPEPEPMDDYDDDVD